jgi:hypothetical protein
VRTRTPSGIRGPQGEGEVGFQTWFPGGTEPVDHNQHALTAVWTAPTGRERGQLADRMSPSRAPIRSERRPTPCGACRDCSYRRSWGLKHSQRTLPTVWRMRRPLGVTQRKWPGHWGMSTKRRWRCWRHYSSRRAQPPAGRGTLLAGHAAAAPAHRALRLVDALAQQDPQRWLEGGITCVDCGI